MGYRPQSTNFFQESEISGGKGRWAGGRSGTGAKKPVSVTGFFYDQGIRGQEPVYTSILAYFA